MKYLIWPSYAQINVKAGSKTISGADDDLVAAVAVPTSSAPGPPPPPTAALAAAAPLRAAGDALRRASAVPSELRGFATAAHLVTPPKLHPALDRPLGGLAEAPAVPGGGISTSLFSTGRGEPISMTVEGRRNAAQVLAQAGINEEAALQQPVDGQQLRPLQGVTPKLGGLFSTAGGRAIAISEQHARRVADMLELDSTDQGGVAPAVAPQHQPPQAQQQQPQQQPQPQQQQQGGPGGLFATASGRPITISNQHLQQAVAALELEPMQARMETLTANSEHRRIHHNRVVLSMLLI